MVYFTSVYKVESFKSSYMTNAQASSHRVRNLSILYHLYITVLCFLLQTVRDHRVLSRLADTITTWDEITTLGLELSCNPNDVARLRSENRSIKGAAYEILRSFYSRNINSHSSIALTLREALTELGKGVFVFNLGLEGLST